MVLMVALSNSETSYHALEWTLEHFFSPMGAGNRNQLVLIHAKRLASSVAKVSGPGMHIYPISNSMPIIRHNIGISCFGFLSIF